MAFKELFTAFGNGALTSLNYVIAAIFASLIDEAEENATFGTIQTFAFVWILSIGFTMQTAAKKHPQNPENNELDGTPLKVGYYLSLLPSAVISVFFLTPLQKMLLEKTSIDNSTHIYLIGCAYAGMGLLQASNFLLTNAAYATKQYNIVWLSNVCSLAANLAVNACFYDLARHSVLGLGLGLSAAGLAQQLFYLSHMSRILPPAESKKFFSRITCHELCTYAHRYKDAFSIGMSLVLDTALNYWLARMLNKNKESTALNALNILLPLKTLLLLLPIEYIQLLFSKIKPHPQRVFISTTLAAVISGALFALTTIPGFFMNYYGSTHQEYKDCVGYLTASLIFDADGFEKRQMMYGLEKTVHTPTLITLIFYLAAGIMMALNPVKNSSNLLLLTMTLAYLLRDIAFNVLTLKNMDRSLFFTSRPRQVSQWATPSEEKMMPSEQSEGSSAHGDSSLAVRM